MRKLLFRFKLGSVSKFSIILPKTAPQSNKIAPNSLDFACPSSIHAPAFEELSAMDAATIDLMARTYLTEVRNRLEHAAGIARAADACAGAGFLQKALEVALDIDQPIYEVTTLLNAASLMNRILKEA